MRLLPSDPDIETLVSRIENNDIDLQPDFQRGEVWPQSKRLRLIDSVLRDWHVPPIHVIQNDDQTVSVLDGQQRLAAIRDFVNGDLRIDGSLPPYDERIVGIDGLSFNDIPYAVRRRFLRFSLRVYTIVDFKPEEPGELFYRLNQISLLTAAEQRNAFFGETHKQVKRLAKVVSSLESDHGIFGFSNARMAYDDVIARSLFLLDSGGLRRKITSASLADRYRNNQPFSSSAVRRVEAALHLIAQAQEMSVGGVRLNKATALTWIVFLASAPQSFRDSPINDYELVDFMARFELMRQSSLDGIFGGVNPGLTIDADPSLMRSLFFQSALFEYEDRATSRVADVSSVVLRDLALWIFLLSGRITEEVTPSNDRKVALQSYVHHHLFDGAVKRVISLEEIAENFSWGVEL